MNLMVPIIFIIGILLKGKSLYEVIIFILGIEDLAHSKKLILFGLCCILGLVLSFF